MTRSFSPRLYIVLFALPGIVLLPANTPADVEQQPFAFAAPGVALAHRLREAGFDIRGIRPPTVPAGTSRLRISLTLNIGKPQIDALATTLSEFLA